MYGDYVCTYILNFLIYFQSFYSTVSDDDESATGNNENIEIVNEGGKNNELVTHIPNDQFFYELVHLYARRNFVEYSA